ncbi:hypothetical protein Fmac_016933 [Flemingia macrophylla]|uniref:Cyclin-dependent protein kinase inhibitor SMR6 n=1 Tax=Flemingia macrophylla TaxID=520843 RepID=A0ABD1ML00_9FABA
MGFSHSDLIAGISLRPLKPINTKHVAPAVDDDGGEACSTTPTAKEARIPDKLPCPPAPRKRRPSRCSHTSAAAGVREFFTPPDLETVFKCRVQKAK